MHCNTGIYISIHNVIYVLMCINMNIHIYSLFFPMELLQQILCVLGCHEPWMPQSWDCQTIVDAMEITWAVGSGGLSSLRSVRLRRESSLKGELWLWSETDRFPITALWFEPRGCGWPIRRFLPFTTVVIHLLILAGWRLHKIMCVSCFAQDSSYWNKSGALHSLTLLDFKVTGETSCPFLH